MQHPVSMKKIGYAASIVLLVILSGAASAAIPDASGVIHGCYDTKVGTLRVIDTEAGQTCATKNETALSWNQTGAQGPEGPAGPTGATGPAGPQGAPGADAPRNAQVVAFFPNDHGTRYTVTVNNYDTVDHVIQVHVLCSAVGSGGVLTNNLYKLVTVFTAVAGSSDVGFADCPAGYIAIGGGYTIS